MARGQLQFSHGIFFGCFLYGLTQILISHWSCRKSDHNGALEDEANSWRTNRLSNRPPLNTSSMAAEPAVNRSHPFIFIGGFPRSGTTLLRAMLDAHPWIRCGQETHIIPDLLRERKKSLGGNWRTFRMIKAGVTEAVLKSAYASFIMTIIAGHGRPARRLCNKDPMTLESTVYLADIFPNSKFVMMIRDGRAAVHSFITNKMSDAFIKNNSDYGEVLEEWHKHVMEMYTQCMQVGIGRCWPLYYERLVLEPEKQLRALLKFLQVPWTAAVLQHEKEIGKRVALAVGEFSSDQVVKAVHKEALTAWVGHFPADVVTDMAHYAPMLKQLGYDPNANPPDYSKAGSVT